jgi:hypothetical protein
MTEIGTTVIDYGGAESPTSISRFHFRRTDLGSITQADCAAAQGATYDFISHLRALFPDDVTFLFPATFAIADEATATLTHDLEAGDGSGSIAGLSSAPWAKGSGIHMRFETADIVRGRHVTGGFFLVPCTADAFNHDGGLSPTALTDINTAGPLLLNDAWTAGLEFVVWGKPLPGATHPRALGFSAKITAVDTPRVSSLRRRRA